MAALGGLALAGCALSFSCNAGSTTDAFGGSGGGASNGNGNGNGNGSSGAGFMSGSSGSGNNDDDCAAAAKLIYLVSVDNQLYSFDPTIDGVAAYKLVGTLSCPSVGSPQSMSVDRDANAYVFYDSGEMFSVSTANAACMPTPYVHPVQNGFNQLGMGFTATTADSKEQTLYIISPDFGLATVALPSYAVTETGALVGAAELTGGPDAKLFVFDASNASLSEINRTALSKQSMHTFQGLQGTGAWAFSRYAGNFYMFTSPGAGIPTTTTKYDPEMDVESVRDASIGFTVVGAGQSTCVPPPNPQ